MPGDAETETTMDAQEDGNGEKDTTVTGDRLLRSLQWSKEKVREKSGSWC